MLSAIQGKFSTPKFDPYSGLQSLSIISRCTHVKNCISQLNIKELHQFFPYLLSNIFGFDHNGGWGLRTFNRTLHSDFSAIREFLGPRGELFHLIAKLDADSLIYEFPIGCLPKPSQQALTEGIVPSFYNKKVQLSYSVDNTPTHIFLSAFEYYFFHFAYFLIDTHQSKTQGSFQAPINVAESLYTHLFEAYVSHYLPFTGTVPSPPLNTPTKGSPVYQHLGFTPPESGCRNLHAHQYNVDSSFSPNTRGGLSATDSVSQQETGVVHSETFVQILVEFWLNQNTCNGSQGDLLSREQTRFFPSEEQLLLLRRFLKQVHYFSNGYTYNATLQQTSLSVYLSITETLRSSIVTMLLQKRLYNFLKHSIKHSSLDNSFRNVLELWLTFIQPWRYLDPNKESAENKESLKTYQDKWRMYVLENFPFYSTLLILFLSRCSQTDLLSNVNHVMFIYRVSKVFSQPKLREFIDRGEHLLFNPNPSSFSPQMAGSPRAAASNIKAVFVNCEGAMFQYNSLFEQNTQEMVQSIMMKVCQAKAYYTQRIPQSTQQQPYTPSTPPSPTLSLTPVHHTLPQISQTTQPVKRSWLKSAWNGLVELFSEDPYHPITSTPSMTTSPKKLVELLTKIEEYIVAFFEPQLLSQSMSHGGSPFLSSSTPHLTTPVSFSGHTHPSTPPSSIDPEYLQGEHRLSPKGKMQVIQGLRKCSNLNIQYMGDPLLQPIRSFENATLVRALYQLSCSLNDKFSSHLAALGTSNRLTSKLLLQLLAPPPPSPHIGAVVTNQDVDMDQPPATPTTRVSSVVLPPSHDTVLQSFPLRTPRINLRPLGSYYTLTYLATSCFLAWLLSIPLWLCLLLLLCFLFLYCIFSYFLTKKHKNRSNKIK